MKFRLFIKDKSLLLILQVVCMALLYGFLRVTGYGDTNSILILCVWILILTVYVAALYVRRRKYFQQLQRILDQVDKRYLLGELMPDSYRLEDRLYQEMIRSSNKSVIERIHQMEQSQKEYREYMESWVHEIKAPITGISLLCENGKRTSEKKMFRQIASENLRIENDVDMVLYYARSEHVYKDYLIQPTNLQEAAYEVLEKNRLLLIENKMCAKVDCEEIVCTDKKWICFILNQILLNSVKYRREETPSVAISARRTEKEVCLAVRDNGEGIRQAELGRIFEKGFTGSNGRRNERATGIGLYLCENLCRQLGIEIRAESEYGRGMCIELHFPINNYIEEAREIRKA